MTQPDFPIFNTEKINLKTYNTILKKSIRLDKKSQYEVLFIKFKDDIQGIWKTINAILNKSKKKKSFPNFFKDGDAFLTDETETINKFNSFF